MGGDCVKCKVIKKAWCPLKKGYILPGETVEIPEKVFKGYAPYVQVVETAKKEPEETAQKEPGKKAKKKSGDG
jgi:hypothetical protein